MKKGQRDPGKKRKNNGKSLVPQEIHTEGRGAWQQGDGHSKGLKKESPKAGPLNKYHGEDPGG